MGTRDLGNLVVRLAVELARYKADWKEAETVTRDGAARVEDATKGMDKVSGALGDTLRRQTGAFGQAAGGALEYAGAAQAATGASTAAAVGLGAVAAALAAVGYAWYEGAKEQKALNDSLLLTGNYAGMVTGQLDRMAVGVASSIGGTVGNAREVLAGLVGTGRFTVESLGEVGTAVQLVARYSGQTNEQVLKHFAGMADGVAKWAAKTNEAYHFLSIEQYRQIKTLEEQGRAQEAMVLAMEPLNARLEDLTRNLHPLAQAWRDVEQWASKAWAAMKNTGKDRSIDDQIKDVADKLELYKSGRGFRTVGTAGIIADAEGELRDLIRRKEILEGNAQAQTANAQATEQAIRADGEWKKITEQNLTRREQMNKALDDARKTAAAAGVSAEQLATVEARIRERYAEKGKQGSVDPYTALLKSARDRVAVLELEATATDKVTEAQKLLAKYETDLAEGTIKFNAVKDQAYRLTLAQMDADENAVAMKARMAKADIEAGKAHEAHISELAKGIDKLQAEIDKQREHNETLGLSKQAVAELEAAKLEEQATALEGLAIRKMEKDLDEGLYDMRLREAAQLRELARLKRDGAAKEAGIEAAKDTAKAWQETGDFIERTLLDSVQAGFRHGENFSKAFFKSLEATAKTTVLRFGVQMVGQGITGMMQPGMGGAANSLAGAFGLGGSATSYGGSNALSMLANGYSLAGMGTSAAGLVGSGVGAIFGGAAGNAALGASLGLGTASSTAAASAAAAAGGTSAAGAGLGASLGAAVPYIGAALLVASMFSGGGETRSGAEYEGTRKIRGPSGGEIGGDHTRAAIQSTQDAINNTLRSMGSSATVGEFTSGLESSGKGKGFAYAGGTLSTGASFGQSTSAEGRANRRGSMSPEQAGAAFSEELKQATLQALQAADVPGQLGDYLRQLGDIDKLSGGALDAAIGRINKALSEKDQLEAQIFAMTATSLEQLNKTREKERAAIDSSNAALLEHVYALQDQQQAAAVLVDAYNREGAALQQTIDRHRDYAKQLREFRDSLLLGEDSPLGPQDRTRVALSQYDQTYARAQAGDLEAIAGLQGASTAYLAALKGSAGSAGEYNAGFAKIMSGLTLTAAASDAAATVGQSQLSVATEQLTQLGLINTNLVSFQDALAGYLAAVANTKSAADAAAAIAAAPAAPDGQTTWSKLHDRVDETIKKMGPGGGSGAVLNGIADAFAGGGGSGYDPNNIPQFATGGMYLGGARIVGEDGPELEVTGPARIFSASQTREILRPSSDATADEIRQLRAQVAQLLEAARASAQHAYRAAKVLDQLHVRGVQIRDRDDQTVPAVHVV